MILANRKFLVALLILISGYFLGCARPTNVPSNSEKTVLSPHTPNDAQCKKNPVLRIRIPKEKTNLGKEKPLANMTRDMLVHFMSQFVDPKISEAKPISDTQSTQDWIEVRCEAIALSARELFFEAAEQTSSATVFKLFRDFLKTGVHYSERPIRHSSFVLPDTLEALEATLKFRKWPSKTVQRSEVKGMPRIIYRSPPKTEPVISISQTKQNDLNESVRETEVVLKRSDGSGHYDFYAYDAKGRLAKNSTFLTASGSEVIGPIPHTCLTCHYNGESRNFQPQPLSFNR